MKTRIRACLAGIAALTLAATLSGCICFEGGGGRGGRGRCDITGDNGVAVCDAGTSGQLDIAGFDPAR